MPEQGILVGAGVPLDSPRQHGGRPRLSNGIVYQGPFIVGSCLDHAWRSDQFVL